MAKSASSAPAKPSTRAAKLPFWANPLLWAVVLSLSGVFATVAPWYQQGNNRSSAEQGIQSAPGKVCFGLCFVVSSIVSVFIPVRPVPRWTAWPPLVVGALIVLAVLVCMLTLGHAMRISYGAYLELLIGLGLAGVGGYQLAVFNKRH